MRKQSRAGKKVNALEHGLRSANKILQENANFQVVLLNDLTDQPSVVKLRYAGDVPVGTSDHVAFLVAKDLRDLAKQLNAIADNLCQ